MAQNLLLTFEMVAWYSWLLRVAHTDKVEDSSSSATFLVYIYTFFLITADDTSVVSNCRQQTLLLPWRVNVCLSHYRDYSHGVNPVFDIVNILITCR